MVLKHLIALFGLFHLGACPQMGPAQEVVRYEEAAMEVLGSRPFPQWFLNAKLGIFIHWGVYSVPAYSGAEEYAEWFLRGLQQGDSLRTRFMREGFGESFQYRDFAPLFKAELFQPEQWADLFRRAGARYVVLVSKHHDGYALWPSRLSPGWNSQDVGPGRDLVGEVSEAVRKEGLRLGLYYSLGEWTHPLYRWDTDPPEQADDYVRQHMMPQFRELISRYRPSLAFSDGDWGNTWDDWRASELVGWYFDTVGSEAVVNDRWGAGGQVGFRTPEYSAGIHLGGRPWAEVRGLGRSFGWNRNEPLDAYLTSKELIHTFVRSVAGGGGMILNVGPRADGQIPLLQQERLLHLGAWLETNGEAIYGAGTWTRSSDSRDVALRRVDPAIDFQWVRNGPGRPIREDQFTATWTGVILPEFTEEYHFDADADDSMKVWISDRLVADASEVDVPEVEGSESPAAEERKGVVSSLDLTAGTPYPIRVEYREVRLNAWARLNWWSESQPREVIPPENLRTGMGPGEQPGLHALYRSRQEWVFYTRKDDTLYAIFFQWPEGELALPIPSPPHDATIGLLGGPEDLPWSWKDGHLSVDLAGVPPEEFVGGSAWTLRIRDYPSDPSH